MFIDPTGGIKGAAPVTLARRLTELKGLRVAMLDNTKRNGDRLLHMVAGLLHEEYGMVVAQHVRKHLASAPATADEVDRVVAGADLVLSGIGD